MPEIAVIIPAWLHVPSVLDRFRQNLATFDHPQVRRSVRDLQPAHAHERGDLHRLLSKCLPAPVQVVHEIERSVAGAWNRGVELALRRWSGPHPHLRGGRGAGGTHDRHAPGVRGHPPRGAPVEQHGDADRRGRPALLSTAATSPARCSVARPLNGTAGLTASTSRRTSRTTTTSRASRSVAASPSRCWTPGTDTIGA